MCGFNDPKCWMMVMGWGCTCDLERQAMEMIDKADAWDAATAVPVKAQKRIEALEAQVHKLTAAGDQFAAFDGCQTADTGELLASGCALSKEIDKAIAANGRINWRVDNANERFKKALEAIAKTQK